MRRASAPARRCLSAKPAVGHSGHLSADSLKNQHDAPDLGLAMSHKHKYLFDLNGYLVLRGVFSPDDVAAANDAVDAHADTYHERTGQLRTSGLYGRESHALAGDGARGRLDMGGLLEDRRLGPDQGVDQFGLGDFAGRRRSVRFPVTLALTSA